jgi:hypothetical protein
MKTALKIWRDDAGQAVIEYILILTVMVGVILGGLYQLNTSFRAWADSYFGDYLACLLESGELPALGGRAGGECGQLYKSFTLGEGWAPNNESKPVIIGGGGAGYNGGSGGGLGSSSGSGGGPDESDFAGGGSGGSSIAYQGRIRSPNLRSGQEARFRVPPRGGGASGESEDGGRLGGAQLTDLSGYKSGETIRISVRNSAGFQKSRRQREKTEENERTGLAVSSIQTEGKKSEQQLIKVDRTAANEDAAPDIEEFTFGKLFRYLLIAALIIAIVIFIGGQALQVSKSMD